MHPRAYGDFKTAIPYMITKLAAQNRVGWSKAFLKRNPQICESTVCNSALLGDLIHCVIKIFVESFTFMVIKYVSNFDIY